MSDKSKEIVGVRVLQHIPQGLSVRLDDGRQGIIRVREISWDEDDLTTWREKYHVGWKGKAALLPLQRDGASELSLRFAQKDPWDEFLDGFDKKQVYEGIVTGITGYGAFIELASGLTGLLHFSKIPAWCKRKITEIFWPGDKVLVNIQKIDRKERRIGLGIPDFRLLADDDLQKISDMPVVMRSADHDMEKLLLADAPRKHVLVVENENDQSEALRDWLRRLGQRADIVESAEEAIPFLEKSQPDIALVDVGLDGMSGTALADHILNEYPTVQVINATDWAHVTEIKDTLDDLRARGAGFLLKPLLPEDLVPFLLEEKEKTPVLSQKEKESVEKSTMLELPALNISKKIRKLMLDCKNHLSFEQIILFSLEPTYRKIRVVESVGNGVVNQKALPSLIYSPVRDVAEDKDVISVDKITESERKRFQYLCEFVPFAVSCVGVPVLVQESSDYALFAFDKYARNITSEERLYVEGVSLAIGTALTQRGVKEKFILMQRTALIGHLTKAMMHEISNPISSLLNNAKSLENKVSKCEEGLDKANCEVIKESILAIQQDIRKTAYTTKMFGKIAAKGRREVLRVDEVIRETLALLRDISNRAHVALYFTPPDDLIIVRSEAATLEHIFLNVVLNAIQQIDELRPEDGGWVKIDLKLAYSEKGVPMCHISIQDNGPGIHVSLWEKIFEMGFTTRFEGSGIGLYISRNLMDDIGGELYVSKSHILGGTLFELKFPATL